MNKLLFLLLSAAVAVSVTAGITRTAIQKNDISHKATVTKSVKATRATGAVAPMVPGQFHGWDSQVSHALRSNDVITWDFEDEEQFDDFNCIDNDGDGHNWFYVNNEGHEGETVVLNYDTHSGDGIVCSSSYYREEQRPLTPDNWLISPRMILGTTLSFFAMGQDETDCYEKFGVYVCVGSPTGVDDFVQIGDDYTTTNKYQEYVVDLSAYEGQVGHFAIVHHNVSDQFFLNIDDISTDGEILPLLETPNVTVTPAVATANVEWDTDEGAENWNLRYRPLRDTAGNPIDCNFNDENYDLEQAGWTLDDADGDGNNWQVNYGYLYSESYDSAADEGLDPDNYLYSPQVKLQGMLRFTCWVKSDAYNNPYLDRLMVYAQIGEEMHPLVPEDYEVSIDHQTETIDLDQFGGQLGRIVFRHYDSQDQYALYLDDIYIGDPDAEVVVPAEWTEVNGLTEPGYTIEGLTPNTKYEVQVMAYNVVNQSEWSDVVDFTTLEPGLGDVNLDGEVNIADVTALIDFLLSGQTAPAIADCDQDGNVSVADVTGLIDYLLYGNWPEPEMVYTVVGFENVFGSNWDPTDERNNMVKGADGIYTWTKTGVTLKGNFEFKVVGDHDWSIYEWPIGMDNNYVVHVAEEGIYTIDITFNPEAAEADRITCTLTRTGDIEHVYTVAGTYNLFEADWDPNYEGNNMVKGDDGIYRLHKAGYFFEGTEIKFKIVQDHSWDHAWPASEDWLLYIPENGAWDFIIKFMPYNNDEDKIAVEVTKVF